MRSGVKVNNPRIYKIWQGMRQRCGNPNDKDYALYGGRGIEVCEEWKSNSSAFIKWAIENGYRDDLSIDRINVDGNYCPENCRWATCTEQIRNRRVQKSSRTGIPGVHYEQDRKRYRAVIYVNNKRIDLGRYSTINEASESRQKGELKYWGEPK